MAIASQDRRLVQSGLAAFLFLAVVAVVVIWRFPPEVYSFYPACPVHEYLHLECPGCGTTRAISALLHGRFAEAVRLNALFMLVVLPGAASYAAVWFWRAAQGEEYRRPTVPNGLVCAAVAIAVAFGVVRNL